MLQKIRLNMKPFLEILTDKSPGEITGHSHSILESLGGKIVSLDSLPGKRFLMLESQAVLTHQEHNPVTLEPGIYSFGQVVEYDYFTEATKQVRD